MISHVCIWTFPTTAAQKASVPVREMRNYPRNVGLGAA